MRITTNALIRNYKSNLSTSINNLNISRTHVMTQRSFNTAAEDPASAARASQLHRKYYKNQDNLKMLDEAQSRQDGQEDALRQVSDKGGTPELRNCNPPVPAIYGAESQFYL